jgi:hypothetical protein
LNRWVHSYQCCLGSRQRHCGSCHFVGFVCPRNLARDSQMEMDASSLRDPASCL